MTTYSKATVMGHPIHPMLVAIPILLYVGTLLGFVVFAAENDPRWFQLGILSNLAAVIAALIAAVPGFIDWATAIPNGTEAKRTATMHMAANLAALGLFAANLIVHREPLMSALEDRVERIGALDPYLPLALTGAGFALVLLAGTLGYRLVHKYHVADAPTPGPSRPGPGSARPVRQP